MATCAATSNSFTPFEPPINQGQILHRSHDQFKGHDDSKVTSYWSFMALSSRLMENDERSFLFELSVFLDS